MSKDSIRTLLQANGSFPDEPGVRANLAALFALSRQQQDGAADLAWGFTEALDQWAHVDAIVPPDIAQPVREWTLAQWATSPYALCEKLCALLVNLATPQTLQFLTEERSRATDADLQRLLDRFIAMHPTSAPAAG